MPLHCQLLWITLMASTSVRNAKTLFESEEAVRLLGSVRPNDAIEMELCLKAMTVMLVDAEDSKATPLHVASKDGHLRLAELLVENGAGIEARNGTGATPLILAARYGHLAIVKLLLEKGAAVDVINDDRSTALHWASQEGHVEIVKLLTEKGAPLEAKLERGRTPVFLATTSGHLPIVKLLFEKGASLHARDEEGQTLLHHACKGDNLELVRFLVEIGLSVNTRSLWGTSPYYIAKRRARYRASRRAFDSINELYAILRFLNSVGAVER